VPSEQRLVGRRRPSGPPSGLQRALCRARGVVEARCDGADRDGDRAPVEADESLLIYNPRFRTSAVCR